MEYSLHDEGAGGLPGVDPAGDDDELLVSDVVDWIGAGDGEDGDIITSQSLTQHLLLHILSSLRVIHDLLQVQHHIRISGIIKIIFCSKIFLSSPVWITVSQVSRVLGMREADQEGHDILASLIITLLSL